jgi:hypothetical protein
MFQNMNIGISMEAWFSERPLLYIYVMESVCDINGYRLWISWDFCWSHSGFWSLEFTLGAADILYNERVQVGFSPQDHPEMEFLDMNLAQDSILLLRAIHSLFYRRILQKTILYTLVLKLHTKNLWNKKNSRLFMNCVEQKNEDRKTRQKLEIQVYAQIPRLKLPFKNTISGCVLIKETRHETR